MPQLLVKHMNGRVTMLLANIVDGPLPVGDAAETVGIVEAENDRFPLGNIPRGTRSMCYLGINIFQNSDRSAQIDAYDKPFSIGMRPITRLHRHNSNVKLTSI